MAFPVTTIPPSSAGGGSSPPFAISDTTGLQDALDDKVDSPLSASDMPTGIDAAKIGDGSVSTTEFQYINTLSSNAQTQISARLPLSGGTMTGDLVVPAANFKPSGSGGSGHFLKQTSSGGAISSAALVPGDIQAARNNPGAAFTNSGTWENLYSLGAGAHTGQIWIYSSLSNAYQQLGINGTSLVVIYGGWAGVGSITGSLTASSSAVAFRVSGGWLQINVGTSVSGAGYFAATFEGVVR